MQLSPRLPVLTAPGQVYGAAAAQRRAQQAVPLQRPAAPPPGTRSAGPSPAQVAGPPPALDSPTARPDEPVTAGSAFGAGPGPEALGLAPDAGLYGQAMTDVQPILPLLEFLASQSGTSQRIRNFVYQARGQQRSP